jgi:hypothetical protein
MRPLVVAVAAVVGILYIIAKLLMFMTKAQLS